MKRDRARRALGARLLCRLLWDFIKSMYVLRPIDPCITIFGSARLRTDVPAYAIATELGRALSRAGVAVMTGGGPGLMEAVNRGAREGGGRSLGCCMAFAFEQPSNRYLDRWLTVRYFFVRKVVMSSHACGYAVLPGGLGTLDELFEILTLIQTKRMKPKPIVLLGRDYWRSLLRMLDELVAAGTVDAADVELITVTDDVADAVRCLLGEPAAWRPAALDDRRAVNVPQPVLVEQRASGLVSPIQVVSVGAGSDDGQGE
jgi:uncharacterized protein (TIGR00730 family)